jgi:hypothetical protein
MSVEGRLLEGKLEGSMIAQARPICSLGRSSCRRAAPADRRTERTLIMTKEQKVIRAKVGLLELARQLGNVSQPVKMMARRATAASLPATTGSPPAFSP